MSYAPLDRQIAQHLEADGIEVRFDHSPNFNERRGDPAVDTLVVHYTALPMAESVTHLSSPRTQVSTHYVIDRDGSLVQLVPVAKRAWHAGVSRLGGRPDVNTFSVGLDLVFVPGEHDSFTDAQYRVLQALTRALRAALSVPVENIVGHEDVALPAGRKADPGPRFDWPRYLAGVNGRTASAPSL